MASILKAQTGAVDSDGETPVVFDLKDVKQSAEAYVADAQQNAQRLLDEAESAAESIREEARLRGLEDAETEFNSRVQEAARKLTELRCRTAIASCESAIENVQTLTADWLELWRDQTVTLAASMAEKLLHREIAQDRKHTLRCWLDDALGSLREARSVRVLVHPDDHAVAEQLLEMIARSIPQVAEAVVVVDPEIELGGCIVRTSHGSIDQQLSTQLQQLVHQLV
jgi:flagellar assembly protein FliH